MIVAYTYRMTLKRMTGLVVGLLFVGGWTLPAHASGCSSTSSANCWIQQDEANDRGYQSAVRGGWNASHSTQYSYTNSSKYRHSSRHSYNQGRELIDSFRRGGCDYEVWDMGGYEQITRDC